MTARVTVGIPSCESALTLARAIGSVRAQTVQDWLLIVSDDASTDASASVAETAASEDSRISVRRQPARRGVMNFGDLLQKVETPYFVWLAADDFWAPEFLSRTLAALDAQSDAVSALPKAAFVGLGRTGRVPDTAPLDGPWPDRVSRFLAHPGGTRMYGLMRSQVIKAAFPPRATHAYDWAVMLGVLARGLQVEIPEVLLFREETDWLNYAESVEDSDARGLYRQLPVLEVSLLALRRGHVPRAAYSDLLSLNLRKHEEYVAICNPAAFGRRLWLYRKMGLPFATRTEMGVAVMKTVAARDPTRTQAAQSVLSRLTPATGRSVVSAPLRIRSAAPPLTAIVTARNAEGTLDRLLNHLQRQGARTVVIDHASTDRTRAIAEARRNAPVFDIFTEPFDGVFDLTAQLRRKRELIQASPEGWIIHADADEFLDAPDGERLCDLISAWVSDDILAAPCRELVFLPMTEDERNEPSTFEATMTRAAPFLERDPKHRLFRTGVDLSLWMATGGHSITTEPARLAATTLTLRHYLGLSLDDLRAQYLGRVFAHGDAVKSWHTNRMTGEMKITAPPPGALAPLGSAEATAFSSLPIFAPLEAEPASALPAGPIDLWLIAAVPRLADAAADIVAANFAGLRIARGSHPPQGSAAVLHILVHPAAAVEGATRANDRRDAACNWLRAIARARQAALAPGNCYAEVRAEDLPNSASLLVLAVRELLLGRPKGAVSFVRPGSVHQIACPGPEVRTITTPMARDLGYGWVDPA